MTTKTEVIRPIRAMQAISRGLHRKGATIGLVPTMGALHEGHLSLVRRIKPKCDLVVVSIFVNPTQFLPHEDFETYPRSVRNDLALLSSVGVSYAFVPDVKSMYPPHFQSFVEPGATASILEGAIRPGHFRGVATVVSKLYHIVCPEVAVFGQKDLQQAHIINLLTQELDFPVKFLLAPTVRESDGLAMSSRNRYFNSEIRPQANALYLGLQTAKKDVRNGERSADALTSPIRQAILGRAPSAEIEYIDYVDFRSFTPQKRISKGVYCVVAARLHGVRLIDNVKLL